MRDDEGWVEITHHTSREMYYPIVNDYLKKNHGSRTCMLTQTNEEAVILVALMRKQGINAKLIQSMEGFRLYNLAEMKYFLKQIDKKIATPLITDELWEEAKKTTDSNYTTSQSMPYIKRCIEIFEQTNKVKYYSDFKEFVFESSIEDFCDTSDADVVVSTIHKAKGREFDDVYMLLSDNYSIDDNLMRRYYVGVTRAKNRLFIHTDSALFDRMKVDQYIVDTKEYAMPEEIVLQLSHKDVNLGYFKNLKREILSLRAGDSLSYDKFILFNTSAVPVAKLSQSMQQKIIEWQERGYMVKSASVRFIVAWKPKDAQKNEPEHAVLLADMVLSKNCF